ncbi:MAG: hypothetical protein AAF696_28905 [Bacteroidota bacterium]
MTSSKSFTPIIVGLLLYLCVQISCTTAPTDSYDSLPTFLIGEFEDDYGVQYKIDQQLFQLLPNDTYHILEVNEAERFIILQNDSLNTFAPSLFTRIDYQKLDNMKPYIWAFCFSSFKEASIKEAIHTTTTQKTDLMKGCNGFPFSRMKPSLLSK